MYKIQKNTSTKNMYARGFHGKKSDLQTQIKESKRMRSLFKTIFTIKA